MHDNLDRALQAKVTRYKLAQLRSLQMLISVGMIASPLAQRAPGILTVGFALAVLFALWRLSRSAIDRMGLQAIRVEGDAIRIGAEICVDRSEVQRWTISKGGAGLLCVGTTYRLRANHGSEALLEECLRALLGAPTKLQKRGSPRARWIAGAFVLAGLAAASFAVLFEMMPLLIAGVPATILGFAVFMTLSTKRIVA